MAGKSGRRATPRRALERHLLATKLQADLAHEVQQLTEDHEVILVLCDDESGLSYILYSDDDMVSAMIGEAGRAMSAMASKSGR